MSVWKTPSSGLAVALLQNVSVTLAFEELPFDEPELPHAARASATAAAMAIGAYFRTFRVLRIFRHLLTAELHLLARTSATPPARQVVGALNPRKIR
jgi:hypothetical protein